MSIKKETCICIIKSVKHLHIKNHWTSPLMKIKWNRKCTKVWGNTVGGENFHTSGVWLDVIGCCLFLVKHVVIVVIFLVVWLIKVLHLLLCPAWSVSGRRFHCINTVVVIILVIRWWFLRFLRRRIFFFGLLSELIRLSFWLCCFYLFLPSEWLQLIRKGTW